MAKYMTRSEAATAKDRAARLMESTGQSDRADEFRRMSVEQYAEHRGATLMDNPRRRLSMPQETGPTKAELAGRIDDIEDLLEEALDPELSREELVSKVKEIQDVVTGEAETCLEEGDDSDLDSDDEADED